LKKIFVFLITAILLIMGLSGCNESTKTTASTNKVTNKQLIFGFTPGPYSDQVKKGIEPYLKKKGYSIKYVVFNDPTQPNFALSEGSLDVNIFQHTAYFENFKKVNHLDLYEVIKVPTAPMGVYSDKHAKLTDLKDGAKIAIPNDPPNVARALRILEKIGFVKLKKGYDPITVSEKDITEKKANFSFVEVEQAQLPRTLPDVDFALVNGNFILASGRKLSSSLYLENPPFEYQNLVAVRTRDKNKQFVKDIIEAYKSPEFQKIIKKDQQFQGFSRPNYFK
jgi:D-methionine transport system substrate-binding protein